MNESAFEGIFGTRPLPILINPIFALLYNTKIQRFHPILFVEKPLPGGSPIVRHRSKGHHTEGFDSRDAAEAHARESAAKLPGCRLRLDVVLDWDGNDMPTAHMYF